MWRLLTLAAVLHLALGMCPDGFELVRDGECRGWGATPFVQMDQAASIAIETCEAIQGKPVIIHDDEHQEYFKFRAVDPNEGFFILGIVCDPKKKLYTWSDGSTIDYKPTLAGFAPELNNNNCTPGQYSFSLHPNGSWNYGGHGNPIHALIYCTTQLAPTPPGADGCDAFADDEDDGVCYQVGAAAKNWQDAALTCKKFGADLASIHNQQENSFIRRLAVSRGSLDGVYIGATSQKNGTFAWVDGTAMDYENYFPGFPKKNFGDCLAMDTSTSAGQWLNVVCDSQLPVACARPQGSTDGPQCTGEDYDEGVIIVSPGFPNTASTPCEWFLTVPAGKRVQVEVMFLEANTCCDSLVLYDRYLGGSVTETLTGSIKDPLTFTTKTSNIVRVSWQPNGGVNVRGMAITYRAV